MQFAVEAGSMMENNNSNSRYWTRSRAREEEQQQPQQLWQQPQQQQQQPQQQWHQHEEEEQQGHNDYEGEDYKQRLQSWFIQNRMECKFVYNVNLANDGQTWLATLEIGNFFFDEMIGDIWGDGSSALEAEQHVSFKVVEYLKQRGENDVSNLAALLEFL